MSVTATPVLTATELGHAAVPWTRAHAATACARDSARSWVSLSGTMADSSISPHGPYIPGAGVGDRT